MAIDQAGFRKGRGTRDQIVNIRWIIEKAREFQKYIYLFLRFRPGIDPNQFYCILLIKAHLWPAQNQMWEGSTQAMIPGGVFHWELPQ